MIPFFLEISSVYALLKRNPALDDRNPNAVVTLAENPSDAWKNNPELAEKIGAVNSWINIDDKPMPKAENKSGYPSFGVGGAVYQLVDKVLYKTEEGDMDEPHEFDQDPYYEDTDLTGEKAITINYYDCGGVDGYYIEMPYMDFVVKKPLVDKFLFYNGSLYRQQI